MGVSRERELAAERAVVGSLYDRLDEVRRRTREDLRRAQHDQTAGTPAAMTEQDAFVKLYAEQRGLVALALDNPVEADAKNLPFGEAEPGATGLELLLSLALKWGQAHQVSLADTLARITCRPAHVLSSALGTLTSSVGQLNVGGAADLCVFDPEETWAVAADQLCSQGKHTPFAGEVSGVMMPGRVKLTLVNGQIAYDRLSPR